LRTTSTVFSSDSGFSHLDGLDRRLDVAVARNHHHLRVDLHLAQPPERDETVDAGQPHVEHHQVEDVAHDPVEAVFAALDGIDVVSFVAQHAAQGAADARLVVDDQNRCFRS
jgi:hypothetical protein